MTRDPLSAFDEETISTVATDAGIDEDELRSILRRHQEGVRDLPGVDDIVYEWRNQFHQDPMVHRSDAVYVLSLRPHVWDEFGDRLEVSDTRLDAVRRVHYQQAAHLLPNSDRLTDDSTIVLTRP